MSPSPNLVPRWTAASRCLPMNDCRKGPSGSRARITRQECAFRRGEEWTKLTNWPRPWRNTGAMYLSTQAAARRLGVAPHTLRRWSASGIMPCVRTAGGHRRFRQEDVDELPTFARRRLRDAKIARERELETVLDVLGRSRASSSWPSCSPRCLSGDPSADCQACMISAFDEASGDGAPAGRVRQRRPATARCSALHHRRLAHDRRRAASPRTRRAHGKRPLGRPGRDQRAARAGTSRRCSACRSPTSGGAIGLLEAIDRERERRFSRQEMRIARAIAASAAVALQQRPVVRPAAARPTRRADGSRRPS